jgi:monoamine oxidase
MLSCLPIYQGCVSQPLDRSPKTTSPLGLLDLDSQRAPDSLRELRRKPRVLVVGAGVAGLAAALELLRKGFEVHLVEARDRVGGRVHTLRHGGYPYEMGAGWIHGEQHNPIYRFAQRQGWSMVKTDSNGESLLFERDAYSGLTRAWSVTETKALFARLERLVDLAKKQWPAALRTQLSLSEGLERILRRQADVTPRERRALRHALRSMNEETEGLEVSALPLHDRISRDADPSPARGGNWIIEGGYDQLPLKLLEMCQSFGDAFKIDLASPLTKDRPLRTRNNHGQGFVELDRQTYRWAVVTLPLAVLKAQASILIPEISPQKLSALQNFDVGHLTKLWLRFSKVSWPVTHRPWLEWIDDDPDRITQFFASPKTPVLAALYGGERAIRQSEMGVDEATNRALRQLRQMFGAQAIGNEMGQLEFAQLTSWSSDPWALGAYSVRGLRTSRSDLESIRRPEEAWLYVGEATSLSNHGTVHGAFEEGLRAARWIDQEFQGGR